MNGDQIYCNSLILQINALMRLLSNRVVYGHIVCPQGDIGRRNHRERD